MKKAHAEPFLHPRHRLADRRRRHAKLPSRNRETSGFRRLNEGIQRSQTVHPRTPLRTIKSDMFGTMAYFSSLRESSSLYRPGLRNGTDYYDHA
jgi:hypothetical protein